MAGPGPCWCRLTQYILDTLTQLRKGKRQRAASGCTTAVSLQSGDWYTRCAYTWPWQYEQALIVASQYSMISAHKLPRWLLCRALQGVVPCLQVAVLVRSVLHQRLPVPMNCQRIMT